jgi:SAM-dependent methyltransferase
MATARSVPVPPPDLRRLVSGWDDSDRWLASGAQDAGLIRETLAAAGRPLDEMSAILDLGCGCGRIARWWADLDGPRVFGSDYDERLTAWCQANLPFVTVETNEDVPPSRFAGSSFDLVYAISLFTHLSVDAQDLWIGEVRRVLRPGGVLLVTLHGHLFANQLSRRERLSFAAGRAVVREAHRSGEETCAAFHPPRYVRRRLLAPGGFDRVSMTPGAHDPGAIPTPMVLQDKYVAERAR